MATSKLFNPKIREQRGDASDATEKDDMFVNIPVHAEVPVFYGPTDSGEPPYPLRLTEKSQQFVKVHKRRPISSAPQEDTKY